MALPLLVVLVALTAGAGCGETKEDEARAPVTTRASEPMLTSTDVCKAMPLSELRELTGDPWRTATPARGYVGCTVRIARDDPGAIYVTISDVLLENKDKPYAKDLAVRFYREGIRAGRYRPVAGVGNRASFRVDVGALHVLDGVVTYKIQVLSEKLQGRQVLAPAKRIYELVRIEGG
jgi:hypothetical protein